MNACVRAPYKMTQWSMKTDTALVLVTLVMGTALLVHVQPPLPFPAPIHGWKSFLAVN